MDSMRALTELMNALDSAPSMTRWSKLMQRFIMERIAMPSPMTMGRRTMASVVRIAACGWLTRGWLRTEPRAPVLLRVNVPPWTSSRVSAPRRAPVGDVGDPAGESGYTQGIGVMHDRNDEAVASGGGYANVDPALVDDRVVVPG